ncbi:MAG: DJ-1/PfpI family protein [Patescibacteria group bacterium]|nr:DJ-1/PfpI family protein [Patescibacteria group bacterium]
MKNILMVVASYDFNETEYSVPRGVFEENGFRVKVASSEKGKCYGVQKTVIDAEFSLRDINVSEFDAVVFIGGEGVEMYFGKEEALNLVKDFFYAGKLVCAICWAPVVLAKAGILTNKKATVWNGAVKDLELADATYTAERVTVDGNIVTANGPTAAEEFAEKIVSILSS